MDKDEKDRNFTSKQRLLILFDKKKFRQSNSSTLATLQCALTKNNETNLMPSMKLKIETTGLFKF